jgi:hypothetical protein
VNIVPLEPLQALLEQADLEGLDAAAEAATAAQVDPVTFGEVVLIQQLRANAYLGAARTLLTLDPAVIYAHLGETLPIEPGGPPPCDPADVCYKKDFECSSVAPNGINVGFRSGGRRRTARISFLACCQQHDIDFYCGGTKDDFHDANNRLVTCIRQQINASPASAFQKALLRGWWTMIFSMTHLRYTFDDSSRGLGFCSSDGSDRNSPEESEMCLCRQHSCLCGGSEPVPLCDDMCRVNSCTLAPPARFQESAWVAQQGCP